MRSRHMRHDRAPEEDEAMNDLIFESSDGDCDVASDDWLVDSR